MLSNLSKLPAQLVKCRLHIEYKFFAIESFITKIKVALCPSNDLKQHTFFYTKSAADRHAELVHHKSELINLNGVLTFIAVKSE